MRILVAMELGIKSCPPSFLLIRGTLAISRRTGALQFL